MLIIKLKKVFFSIFTSIYAAHAALGFRRKDELVMADVFLSTFLNVFVYFGTSFTFCNAC